MELLGQLGPIRAEHVQRANGVLQIVLVLLRFRCPFERRRYLVLDVFRCALLHEEALDLVGELIVLAEILWNRQGLSIHSTDLSLSSWDAEIEFF